MEISPSNENTQRRKFNFKSFGIRGFRFLISNREGSVEEAPIVGRTRRAGSNILETLPAFLALAILSIMLEVENYNLAMFWIGSRVIYYFSYMFGVLYLRTIIWFVSIVCLAMMGIALI